MIRKAVGAIVFHKDEYLLVNKKRSVSTNEVLEYHWDFPKGAIEPTDQNCEVAIMRELKEETGSGNYSTIKKFDSKICFDFPENHKYTNQETTVFLVEFKGLKNELKADGYEIEQIDFFSKECFKEKIKLKETMEFLSQNEW